MQPVLSSFVRKRERVHELAETLRLAGINNCYLEHEISADQT